MRCIECSKHCLGFSYFILCGRPIILFGFACSLFLERKTVSLFMHQCSFIFIHILQSTFPISVVKISVRVCVCLRERKRELKALLLPYQQLRWLLRFAFLAFVRDRCHMAKGQVLIRCHKICVVVWEYDVVKSTDFPFLILVVWYFTITLDGDRLWLTLFVSKKKKHKIQMTWFSGST